MLSDEEKEIFNNLKEYMQSEINKGYHKFIYNDLDWDFKCIDCINAIDKVLKQSKEIEELRTQIDEHVYYDLGGRSCGKTELLRHYKKGYDMNNKFWKDKIKAIIEEYEEKIKKIEEKDVWEEPYDIEKYVRYTNYISVLQSLLEKE